MIRTHDRFNTFHQPTMEIPRGTRSFKGNSMITSPEMLAILKPDLLPFPKVNKKHQIRKKQFEEKYNDSSRIQRVLGTEAGSSQNSWKNTMFSSMAPPKLKQVLYQREFKGNQVQNILQMKNGEVPNPYMSIMAPVENLSPMMVSPMSVSPMSMMPNQFPPQLLAKLATLNDKPSKRKTSKDKRSKSGPGMNEKLVFTPELNPISIVDVEEGPNISPENSQRLVGEDGQLKNLKRDTAFIVCPITGRMKQFLMNSLKFKPSYK